MDSVVGKWSKFKGGECVYLCKRGARSQHKLPYTVVHV